MQTYPSYDRQIKKDKAMKSIRLATVKPSYSSRGNYLKKIKMHAKKRQIDDLAVFFVYKNRKRYLSLWSNISMLRDSQRKSFDKYCLTLQIEKYLQKSRPKESGIQKDNGRRNKKTDASWLSEQGGYKKSKRKIYGPNKIL